MMHDQFNIFTVVFISWGVIFIIVNKVTFEDWWRTILWIIDRMQSCFYCFNTNVVLTNITYQVLLCFVFLSVLHFVHWLWKYRDCQSVWFSWTPRRAADNRTCKKVQVLGLSCVKRAGLPNLFTGIWQNWTVCLWIWFKCIWYLFTVKCFALTLILCCH